jgi:hypothetical protein
MGFRYSAPLIIPEASSAKERITQEEITYLLNAVRTLAAHVDQVTGALGAVETDWTQVNPLSSIVGGNGYRFHCRVGADIAYGAMVNFYNYSATEVQARPARANVFTNAAGGFCATPGGFTAGGWGEFIVGPGVNPGITGMTPGTWYFLDPASLTGQVTAVAPAVPGQVYQNCGVAIKDNILLVGALNSWLVV